MVKFDIWARSIFIVNRANTGLHILQLEGEAKEIIEGKN